MNKEVKEELRLLRLWTYQTQRDKLNWKTLHGLDPLNCVYGQLCGYPNSTEAINLQTFTAIGYALLYTPLESYLVNLEYSNTLRKKYIHRKIVRYLQIKSNFI